MIVAISGMGQSDGFSNRPTSTYMPERLFKTELKVLEYLQEGKRAFEPSKSTRWRLRKVSGSRGKTDAGFLNRLMRADYIIENPFGICITGLGEEAIYRHYTESPQSSND